MKRIIAILALISGFTANAQQDAMFTHYAFNTLGVNPGYAGSRDALTITGLHRKQWVGFDGAPTTQTLTLHTPIWNDEVGLGLSVGNDKIGPINTTSVYGDFAYKLPVGLKGKLAFGLKGGMNIMQGGLSTLNIDEENDVAFQSNIRGGILPNFGFGMYYSTTNWYVGLSTPRLLENDYTTNAVTGSASDGEQRHYFAIAGTVFNLKSDGALKLKTTTFIKITNAVPIEADLTAMLIIKDKIEVGLMGRTGDALGILIGYNFTEQLRFGYSFDWSFVNSTGRYNAGSHEAMLRYDFIMEDRGRIKSPRHF